MEDGSIMSLFLENSFWYKLMFFRKADHVMVSVVPKQ